MPFTRSSFGKTEAKRGGLEQTTPAASRRFDSNDYKESMESLILAQNER
jgi:hypothetical protein